MERNLTFSIPVATAEFSIFAGISSAAVSQHHLAGFEISTGIPSSLLALFVVMLSKAHLTSHSRMSGMMSDHTVVIIRVVKIFFVEFFCVFLPPLLNIFYF